MINILVNQTKNNYKVIIFDIMALITIYFIPVFSHQLSLPLYYLEPMRIALMFAILFTSFSNSLVIAITLPIFSFFISAHPVLIKSILISSELVINVLAFFMIKKQLQSSTASFAISVILSKIYYYPIKYFLLSMGFLSGTLISTPIYFQGLSFLIIAIAFWAISKKRVV